MRLSKLSFAPLMGLVGFGFGFVGCLGGGSDGDDCIPGTYFCMCVDGTCTNGLICTAGYCLSASGETGADAETGDGDPGDGDPGDGDPGDGDPGDGDPGDGDPGDGDPGDGDPGDGDPGDGDPGDGDPGDGDGDGDTACPFALTLTPPDVMFVVDTSGSMVNTTWNHDANGGTPQVTPWYSLHAVLDAALDEYAPLLNAGVKRFPSSTASGQYNATACTITATPEDQMSPNNAAGIMAAIPIQAADSNLVRGGSPTRLAIETAVDHLWNDGSANTRAIVLISDGLPNCDPTDPFPNLLEDVDPQLVPTIADAYDVYDIVTYVIGIGVVNMVVGNGNDGVPFGNPYTVLQDSASAGGTSFYNSTTQTQMSSSLATILDEVACVVDLTDQPGGAPMPQQVPGIQFELNGNPIPFQVDCDNNGWMWVVEGERARFCGSYCEQYKADSENIDVDYCGG